MASASSGIVTILFTELVGHTALYNRLGETEALRLITSHFQLLRRAVKKHGGREVKLLFEGDSLMAAFPTASGALRAAVSMQQEVDRENKRAPRTRLSMRVGLNTGEPVAQGDDLFGTAVIVARRLCDRAKGGQILASESVHALVRLQGEFDFTDVGLMELKGIEEAVRAYSVSWRERHERTILRTILFADVVGSSAVLEEMSDEAARRFLREHISKVQEQAAAHGGEFVKGLGDGFILAFRSARQALRCAEVLQRMASAYWAQGTQDANSLCMGLHTGQVAREDGDVYGRTVIVAARLCRLAERGETLASFDFKKAAEDSGSDADFGEGREVELRGLKGTVRAFTVSW